VVGRGVRPDGLQLCELVRLRKCAEHDPDRRVRTAELTNRTNLNHTPSSISTAPASTTVSVEITDVTAHGS
jgi:hypothetical protein